MTTTIGHTCSVTIALQRSRIVESFGLSQQSIRKLKYGPFAGQVDVYVGAVGSEPQIYVFISGNSWPPAGQVPLDEFLSRYQHLAPQKR